MSTDLRNLIKKICSPAEFKPVFPFAGETTQLHKTSQPGKVELPF